MKKNRNLHYSLFFAIALLFVLNTISCNPIEAITDTYADIIDEVVPDDENKEENVGEVIISAITLSTNTVTSTVTVLNQLGNVIPRIVGIGCTFTNVSDNTVISQTSGVTTDGIGQCNAINGTSLGLTVSQVAVSEGVSSQAQVFFLGVT